MRISTAEKHQIKTNTFNPRKKTICLSHYLSDKGFKGTVVNRALPSLHEGSLKTTCTVPLHEGLLEISRTFPLHERLLEITRTVPLHEWLLEITCTVPLDEGLLEITRTVPLRLIYLSIIYPHIGKVRISPKVDPK